MFWDNERAIGAHMRGARAAVRSDITLAAYHLRSTGTRASATTRAWRGAAAARGRLVSEHGGIPLAVHGTLAGRCLPGCRARGEIAGGCRSHFWRADACASWRSARPAGGIALEAAASVRTPAHGRAQEDSCTRTRAGISIVALDTTHGDARVRAAGESCASASASSTSFSMYRTGLTKFGPVTNFFLSPFGFADIRAGARFRWKEQNRW